MTNSKSPLCNFKYRNQSSTCVDSHGTITSSYGKWGFGCPWSWINWDLFGPFSSLPVFHIWEYLGRPILQTARQRDSNFIHSNNHVLFISFLLFIRNSYTFFRQEVSEKSNLLVKFSGKTLTICINLNFKVPKEKKIKKIPRKLGKWVSQKVDSFI